MRAPWTSVLLVTAAVGLAVAGCASQPKEDEAARTVNKPACADDAANPLHLTTLRKEVPRDPELETLLNQSSDPRLLQINREMYQTLRTLDAELRRRQQMAACERGDSDIQPQQAQSTPSSGNGNGVGSAGNAGSAAVAAGGSGAAGGVGGAGAAGGGFPLGSPTGTVTVASGSNSAGSNTGTAANGGAPTMATSAAGLSASGAGSVAAMRTTLIRKSSVPPTTSGGGGNGATAQKVSAGSDNDIVARRLRKAAEQEADPAVKAKLWKEYAQYQQGNAAK